MNFKKIFFGFLVLILLSVCSKTFPQSGVSMSVYGHVIDLNTNEPLQNITINILKIENDIVTETYEGISNSTGFFKVRNLKTGKYRFMIEIPDIGIIHVFIMSNPIINKTFNTYLLEYQNMDDYYFDIKEWRNLNLNILLKEDYFPYIEKSNHNEIINFTMHYRKIEQVQNAYQRENSQMSYSSNNDICPGLTIEPDIKYKPVGDHEKIIHKDEECVALFAAEVISNPNIKYEWGCKDDSCIYKPGYTTSSLSRYIKHHSLDWIKKTWEKYKGMNLSEKCANCLNQSYIYHEEYHAAKFPEIAQDQWCKFIEILNKSKTECCDKDTCRKNITKLLLLNYLTNL